MLAVAAADTLPPPPPPHHHRSQSLIQFNSTDKFFSKLRSKDSNPSFRVYYNETTGSVPFKWETTPGTPKHALFSDNYNSDLYVAPPLTPPPSFFKIGSGRESERIRGSRNAIGGFLLHRIQSMKARISHSSSSESVSSESSGDVDRKTPSRIGNWRSISALRFSMRFGKCKDSNAVVLSKATSFGGCFRFGVI